MSIRPCMRGMRSVSSPSGALVLHAMKVDCCVPVALCNHCRHSESGLSACFLMPSWLPNVCAFLRASTRHAQPLGRTFIDTVKADCFVPAARHNRQKHSQSGLSACLLILLSPSDANTSLHAGHAVRIVAVRSFYCKKYPVCCTKLTNRVSKRGG